MNEKDLANRFRAEVDRHRKEIRQLVTDINQKVDHIIELHRELRSQMARCRCNGSMPGGECR